MYDRFLVPYYFFWPIAFLSFIFVFFLPINSQIEINYSKNNIITNDLNRFLFNNYTEECNNFFKDIENNNQKEIKLVKSFNLTIEIVIIILFGLAVLNIIFLYFAQDSLCYDEDQGGHCQTWEYTFSCNDPNDNSFNYFCFFTLLIFLFICVGIIILSFLSIYYSSEFKNKMESLCKLRFGEDYDIHFWKIFPVFLGLIIGLYFIEIIFIIYSLLYSIIFFCFKKK